MKFYGIRSKASDWLSSYLSNHQQRVEMSGTSPSWKHNNCGVPQGSILGPLLFFFYINDFPSASKNTGMFLFADDTSLSALGCTALEVQNDLNHISVWLNATRLFLNLDKTVQLKLGLSASSLNQSFSINHEHVTLECVCEYLGTKIDSKLSFQTQVQHVSKKLATQSGIACKLRHFFPEISSSVIIKPILNH